MVVQEGLEHYHRVGVSVHLYRVALAQKCHEQVVDGRERAANDHRGVLSCGASGKLKKVAWYYGTKTYHSRKDHTCAPYPTVTINPRRP